MMLQTELDHLYSKQEADAIPLSFASTLSEITLTDAQRTRLKREKEDETIHAGEIIPLYDEQGELKEVVVGYNEKEPLFTLGDSYQKLPLGHYRLPETLGEEALYNHLLAFGLGAYQFNQYKEAKQRAISFYLPENVAKRVKNALSAHYLIRDLINEPANTLTPDNFVTQIRAELLGFPVTIKEIVGSELLKQNFPLIYTVGAGSKYQPRLVEIIAEKEGVPQLTLVGKGVTFDTGGLDIKPSNSMRYMQKDMGGAAHMLALGKWILQEEWNVSLRILLPIVENSVSDRSMRPGDIVKSRNGMSVEIDNTDAEGRLILCDALTYALEKPCDFLIDFATLTGAARVALGTEIPALFTNDDAFAQIMQKSGEKNCDTVWRLPFHQAYNEWIDAETADVSNSGSVPFAGAITAALFLERFTKQSNVPFAHVDLMAWNIRHRPGRPKGGEAMGLRAAFDALKERLSCQ
ncbi:cytosol aminopeptidase [Ignatzschineria indica]|uniref:Aminopeptidase n=1 Tax=Ignatzschineria indica TaxID=472583 RepID=A0A2U2AJT5_9GAMM|nr:leucyl aminopeptidase family protein [Ignatzschineria indica]PWD83009.1 aminopeptidase [Ignatzschineria indica]GGZ83624.1 cytosol aminopeptidase [Ignatzschineria indica]